jgi:zinc transport system permease protein
MIYSILLGCVFCVAGLWISYTMNIASGASIVILSVICYLILYMVHAIRMKSSRRRIAGGKDEAG